MKAIEQNLSKLTYSAKDYVQDGLIASWDSMTSKTDINSYLVSKLLDIGEARTRRELTMIFSIKKFKSFPRLPEVRLNISGSGTFGYVQSNADQSQLLVFCGDSAGTIVPVDLLTGYIFIALVIGDPNKESWTSYTASSGSETLQVVSRNAITKNTEWELLSFEVLLNYYDVNQVLIYNRALPQTDIQKNWFVDKRRFAV